MAKAWLSIIQIVSYASELLDSKTSRLTLRLSMTRRSSLLAPKIKRSDKQDPDAIFSISVLYGELFLKSSMLLEIVFKVLSFLQGFK